MPSKRIAFQGEPGAYSEEALFLLAPDAESQPHREFRDVARAVLEHRADLGLLPIENSVVGSIATNFDLIAESALAIVGEVVRAGRRARDALGARGAGDAGRGDHPARRVRALHAARVTARSYGAGALPTIRRHAKYTGTPSATMINPRPA